MEYDFDPIHQARGIEDSQLLRWIKFFYYHISWEIPMAIYIAYAETMKTNQVYYV